MQESTNPLPTEDIILSIIGSYPKGNVYGRTLLQKLVYLVSVKIGFDLDFHPHYYGPYSERIANATADLISFGFVRENRVSNEFINFGKAVENVAYQTEITDEGRNRFERLKSESPVLLEQISKYVTEITKTVENQPAIKSLSMAAKFFEILKNENREMTIAEIKEAAREVGWSFTDDDLYSAQKILENLELIGT